MPSRALAAAVTTLAVLASAGGVHAGKKTPPTPRPRTTAAAVKVPLKAPTRPMAELEAALQSADAATRRDAAWELAGAGTVPESVGNRLRSAFSEDADAGVRAAAVWAFAHVRQGVAQADGTLQPVPYDEPPRVVQQAKFVYPEQAAQEGIQGKVVVEVVVDEEGRVAHAEVRESVPAFDEAALSSVRQWRFAPARLDGKPIATVVAVPVEFTLRHQE